MKIVSTENKRKGLISLRLEDGRELLVDSEIVIAKDLRPGVILDDPDALLYESDLKRAKGRALWYLSRGDLSEKKLAEKLTQGGFSPEAVSLAVERMKELDLINDEQYATRLYRYMSEQGSSKREILFKLQNKGIPHSLAKQVIENDQNGEIDKLQKLIKSKYALKLGSEEGVRKAFNALIRKGFSFSDVRDALKAYSEELENSEEY